MEKYLKHKENGRVFPWSAALAKNSKFVLCNKDGLVTAPSAESIDLGAALAAKDDRIALLESEVAHLTAHTKTLEAKLAALVDPRHERLEDLASMDRSDLLVVAKESGIDKAANTYRAGSEDKLIEEILKIEFPEDEESSSASSGE